MHGRGGRREGEGERGKERGGRREGEGERAVVIREAIGTVLKPQELWCGHTSVSSGHLTKVWMNSSGPMLFSRSCPWRGGVCVCVCVEKQ